MRGAAALLASATLTVSFVGCGGQEDFKNEPRPAAAIELTGVIEESRVTISPHQVGAGPVTITVSNQTQDAHTLTLDGDSVRERVGPVNPLDTVTIQKTLDPGNYELRAGSAKAVAREIRPAELRIGKERKSSSDQVGLP